MKTGSEVPQEEEGGLTTMQVHIIRDMHCQQGHVGIIVGIMQCFMDVKVAGHPQWILRVCKMTVVLVEVEPKEPTRKEKEHRMWVAEVLEAEQVIGEMLVKICVWLARHEVLPGDVGAYTAHDAGLEVVQQMWRGMV